MHAGPGRWQGAIGVAGRMVRKKPAAEPAASAGSASAPAVEPSAPELRARIAHLEQLVQGLQDSVYRESQRVDRRLAELEKRADPAAVAAALSKDARERGL